MFLAADIGPQICHSCRKRVRNFGLQIFGRIDAPNTLRQFIVVVYTNHVRVAKFG